MITPAYALTATERVLPRLALDFTTGVLDSRVTVARALNTATRYNSSGYIETVNANLPRFDYDPVTLAPKGLLIEESRINSLPQSQDFNTAAWTKSNLTISASAITSPDGTANAYKLEETSAAGIHAATQTPTMSLNTTYTLSVYAKAAERDWIALNIFSGTASNWTWFNVRTGVIGTAINNPPRTIQPIGNGWYRCTVTVTTAASGSPNIAIFVANTDGSVSYTGVTGSGVYPYGAQLEAGAFATSYIPTTTTSLTRNADVVSMTGTNFSSWFNASEGTLSFEGSIFVDQGATTVDFIQMSNGVSNSISIDLAMFGANAPVFQVSNSGTQCSIDTGTLTVNTVFKMVGAYKENAFVAAMNGQSPGVDNSGTIPSGLVQMGIGNRLSGPLMNGHARKIAYWPQRLINAETQAFSKG